MLYKNFKKCNCGHTKNAHTSDCTNRKHRTGNLIDSGRCRGYQCDCGEFSPTTKQLKSAEHQSYESR